MDINEILELNNYCESSVLEVKVDLTKEVKKKFLRSVISFLNCNGGHFILGINDNFEVVGIDQNMIDEYISWLSNKLATGIFNYVQEEVSLSVEEKEGKLLIVAEIKAGSKQIYYELSKGIYTGTYIRVGTTTQVMDRMKVDSIQQKFIQIDLIQISAQHQYFQITQLENELKKRGASVSDIALYNFGLYREEKEKTKLYELLSDENTNIVNFASFDGTDRVNLIERENFGEIPLFVTTRKLLEKIELYNKTTSLITGIERIDSKLVDPIAIRELVVNAIVHNDYSIGFPNVYWYKDRVEITSNGGLPIGMTFDEFYNGQSRPRNPKLAFIFTKLGLVEQLGSGVERVLKYYDKSIFDITDSYFKVTLKFSQHQTNHIQKFVEESVDLSKKERSMLAVLKCIIDSDGIALEDIMAKVNMSETTVYRYLNLLIKNNEIKKQKVNGIILYYKK